MLCRQSINTHIDGSHRSYVIAYNPMMRRRGITELMRLNPARSAPIAPSMSSPSSRAASTTATSRPSAAPLKVRGSSTSLNIAPLPHPPPFLTIRLQLLLLLLLRSLLPHPPPILTIRLLLLLLLLLWRSLQLSDSGLSMSSTTSTIGSSLRA